ncbi:hypothetical protein AB1L07_08260 [Niallia alba]
MKITNFFEKNIFFILKAFSKGVIIRICQVIILVILKKSLLVLKETRRGF